MIGIDQVLNTTLIVHRQKFSLKGFKLGHEQMLIFNIQTFLNFPFQMFECLLMPTQWVFNSLINLCSDNFMVKIPNRYLPLLTYSNKVTFCIKFAHKSGINTINQCLEAKILLTNDTQMNEHSNVPTFVHALV